MGRNVISNAAELPRRAPARARVLIRSAHRLDQCDIACGATNGTGCYSTNKFSSLEMSVLCRYESALRG